MRSKQASLQPMRSEQSDSLSVRLTSQQSRLGTSRVIHRATPYAATAAAIKDHGETPPTTTHEEASSFAGKLSPLPLSSALLPGLVSLRPPSGARVGNPDLSCDTPDYPSPTSLLRNTPSCEDGRRKQEDSRRHGRPLHADVQH